MIHQKPMPTTQCQRFKTNHPPLQGYGVGKQLVESFSTVKDGQFSVAQVSAAGFFSAIPQTIITAPFERVKVLLQIQGQKQLGPGEKPKYAGGTDVVRQLYKEGGIRSVYRGSVMTVRRFTSRRTRL
jgi:solute carrier family 25 carnitine/acylcarnitine transporter 20/29